MNIVVCIKQVPDNNFIEYDYVKGSIDTTDLIFVANPYDIFALTHAIEIKESIKDSAITVISLGPAAAKRILRDCLALGADRAILISSQSEENWDSHVTAVLLGKAISQLQHDLILCGEKAIDTEAGMVGTIIADCLDLPVISRVTDIEISSDATKLTVQRKLDKGMREKLKCDLPALLAVEATVNEQRYASLPSLINAIRADIEEYSPADLGYSQIQLEREVLKNKLVSFSPPKPRAKKIFTPSSNLSAADRMRMLLSGGVAERKSELLQGNPEKIADNIMEFLSTQKIISK